MPIMEKHDSHSQCKSLDAENNLNLTEEMKDPGRYMHGVFVGKTLLYLLCVILFPFMGNSEKFAGQKSMHNCAQKDKAGDQIKRFLFDTVTENCCNAIGSSRPKADIGNEQNQ